LTFFRQFTGGITAAYMAVARPPADIDSMDNEIREEK